MSSISIAYINSTEICSIGVDVDLSGGYIIAVAVNSFRRRCRRRWRWREGWLHYRPSLHTLSPWLHHRPSPLSLPSPLQLPLAGGVVTLSP